MVKYITAVITTFAAGNRDVRLALTERYARSAWCSATAIVVTYFVNGAAAAGVAAPGIIRRCCWSG